MHDWDVIKFGINEHTFSFQRVALCLLQVSTFFVVLRNVDPCWRRLAGEGKVRIKSATLMIVALGQISIENFVILSDLIYSICLSNAILFVALVNCQSNSSKLKQRYSWDYLVDFCLGYFLQEFSCCLNGPHSFLQGKVDLGLTFGQLVRNRSLYALNLGRGFLLYGFQEGGSFLRGILVEL